MKYTFDIPEMKGVSKSLKDLISSILVTPEKRPTASQILQHPWMQTKTST
jgi:serine/threonine protein kinase